VCRQSVFDYNRVAQDTSSLHGRSEGANNSVLFTFRLSSFHTTVSVVVGGDQGPGALGSGCTAAIRLIVHLVF
jgi:hypothetical protein